MSSPFSASNLLRCGDQLRAAGRDAGSMEQAAEAVVGTLRDRLTDETTGRPAAPLVRFYVTRRSDQLPPELQDYARAAGTDTFASRNVTCLTLLASAGEEPAWNDRRTSVGHRAIPLPSVEALRRLPMIAQLVEQLGLDPRHVIRPDPALFHDLEERTYNVFFVPEARDSPFVPAQNNFVIPYGIRSVVGFGGILASGDLFSVVIFSAVPIPSTSLPSFAAVALSVKVAVLHFADVRIFADEPPLEVGPGRTQRRLESLTATLTQLLDARAHLAEAEPPRLEATVGEVEAHPDEAAGRPSGPSPGAPSGPSPEAASGPGPDAPPGDGPDSAAEGRTGHGAVFDGAPDAIVGMDDEGRITDFNPAAEVMFARRRGEILGELVADLLVPPAMRSRHEAGLRRFRQTGEGAILGRRIEVNGRRGDGSEFPVELTVVAEEGQSVEAEGGTKPTRFYGFVRDVTAARQAVSELGAGRERLAHTVRTLQTSLLPAALPHIDGIDLGASFRALGDGYEVGGDFYDVFEIPDGRWAVTLGDVCGKGSEAAIVTALCRYTLRGAAMQAADPSEVLTILNRAIHRQHPDRFCTVVYLVVDPETGEVELSLGGHPQPLLRRADGAVTQIGTFGRILGSFDEWRGRTDRFRFRAGETLLLYTDGVTEARLGTELYGEARLVTTLATAVDLDAAAVAGLVEAGVIGFAGSLNDDLAIVALQLQ